MLYKFQYESGQYSPLVEVIKDKLQRSTCKVFPLKIVNSQNRPNKNVIEFQSYFFPNVARLLKVEFKSSTKPNNFIPLLHVWKVLLPNWRKSMKNATKWAQNHILNPSLRKALYSLKDRKTLKICWIF